MIDKQIKKQTHISARKALKGGSSVIELSNKVIDFSIELQIPIQLKMLSVRFP